MLRKGNSNRGVGKVIVGKNKAKIRARDIEEGKTREWILRDLIRIEEKKFKLTFRFFILFFMIHLPFNQLFSR